MLAALALAAVQTMAQTTPTAPSPPAVADAADTVGADTIGDVVFRPVSATSAILVVRSDGATRTIAIGSIDDALALLADTRLRPIWPQVTQWAGPGLETLRNNAIDAARGVFAKGRTKAADTSLGSTVSPPSCWPTRCSLPAGPTRRAG